MKLFQFTFILFFAQITFGQVTKKVCFLGNSYTYVNDLPSMVGSLATAAGNTLIKDQNTPGGYTLNGHSTNPTSLAVISSNNWDFVVLQDQSQIPSFPWSQVVADVFPYAKILADSIRSANECAIPLFYNTWGRRDGDPQWDSINTFDKMNQRLLTAYTKMADDNSGMNAPIGVGFNHVQDDGSSPITHTALYATDGSHPSVYGSYLAACVFYELIYNEDVQGNTYTPVAISGSDATYLQTVAHHLVNDVDSLDLDFTTPEAAFSYTTNGTIASFSNESSHDFSWLWNFGDGSTSTDENPTHDYGVDGSFTVTLTASYCAKSDDSTNTITIDPLSITEVQNKFIVYPNPSNTGEITIKTNQDNANILVHSLDGKLIYSAVFSNHSQLKLESGEYVISIDDTHQIIIVQ